MNSFYYALYIKTTLEQLWKALTSPDFTARYWWGRKLESDWKVGSDIKAVYDENKIDWQGMILINQPYTKLSFTFHLEENPSLKNDAPSVVTYEIGPAGKSAIKLTVSHVNLSAKGFEDVSEGWPQLLCSLKSLLESGHALEYN
jgi:uncharacterized protein YndB with AHSA1/START domain